MPVDELIDQLASLSLRARPAVKEGTSGKLEYKNKGEFYDQLPLFSSFFERQHSVLSSATVHRSLSLVFSALPTTSASVNAVNDIALVRR